MVVEVAAGVFIGIVLAALFLRYWREIISSVSLLFIVVLALGLVGGVGYLAWNYISQIVIYAAALILVIILYGCPFLIHAAIKARYADFGALLAGTVPWNTYVRFPLRMLIMIAYACSLALIGLGALYLTVELFDRTGLFN